MHTRQRISSVVIRGRRRLAVAWLAAGVALALGGGTRVRGADCNQNGVEDAMDLAAGTSADCDLNGVPDECQEGQLALEYEDAYFPYEPDRSALGRHVLTDLDGDGDLDIAVALLLDRLAAPVVGRLRYDRHLAVFLNAGDGTFAPPSLYETGLRPDEVMTVDLEGDGDVDLVTLDGAGIAAESTTTSASVFENQGDGTFVRSAQLRAAANARSLRAADLDGRDGLDLFLTDVQFQVLLVFLRQPDGAYSEPWTYPTEGAVYEAWPADMDGDGDIDVVHRESPFASEEHKVTVRWNDGTGDLSVVTSEPAESAIRRLILADVDGNGAPDVITTTSQPPTLGVYLNDGTGNLTVPEQRLPLDHPVGSLVATDLEPDGDLDLVAARWSYDGNNVVVVAINQGDGTFGIDATFDYGAERHPQQVVPADIDGDGDLDILTPNYSNYQIGLSLIENLGAAGFAPPVDIPTEAGAYMRPSAVVAGDLDLDGDLDVVAGGDGRLSVLRNGSFQASCETFVRGDVNQDGGVSIADVAMLYRGQFVTGFLDSCYDAADILDDEDVHICDMAELKRRLFSVPEWTVPIAAPSGTPGVDPTYEPVLREEGGCRSRRASPPLGCFRYDPRPPETSDALVELDEVEAQPGETVAIPVHVTSESALDTVQLVVAYDPSLVALQSPSHESLRYDGTVLEDGGLGVSLVTAHPESRVLVIAIAGHADNPGAIPAGERLHVADLLLTVLAGAQAGETIALPLTDGAGGDGVGPFRLRNEISYLGETRYVNSMPQLAGGLLKIVGDQSLFIRGDADLNGTVEMADALLTLGGLFSGAHLPCLDAADADDTGHLDLTDPIALLDHLFIGQAEIPPPNGPAGRDPTPDTLGCAPRGDVTDPDL